MPPKKPKLEPMPASFEEFRHMKVVVFHHPYLTISAV
jgi:hypothetical protein